MVKGVLHINTPYKYSHPLSKISELEVYLKLENVQPPGSYKIRGMGNMCQKRADEGCTSFVCSSGGNAGMAAAYAAKKLNIPISIFVPTTTPDFTVQRLREEGADVTVLGAAWDEANEAALKFADKPNCAYLSPFDHPYIWEGHATVIEEIGEKPDLVICSVGGGGLLCGIVQGLEKKGWKDVPVLAVETHGADSLYQAIQADKLVTLPAITSIAKTLGAKTVAQEALEVSRRHKVIPCLVSDRDTILALTKFLDDERILVEPSCAASFAVLYNGMLKEMTLENVRKVAVIVCGGSSVNMDMVAKWRKDLNC